MTDSATDPAKLIDGKGFAEGLRGRVAQAVAALKAGHGITPGLAVVLVGEDPASQVYVRNKAKQTVAIGMQSFEHRLPATTPQAELMALVRQLNADKTVHGILVQLPLPKPLNSNEVVNAVDPAKDVDGLHPFNAGRLLQADKNSNDFSIACTPLGCLMLLKDKLGSLAGKEALVIGRSILVGKPMANLLVREDCTVTVAHSRTADLAGHCRRADIVVAAIGQPRFVQGDWIKPDACVIDVGMNRIDAGNGKTRLIGDVDFAAALPRVRFITPVPGGVGPMTIACLLHNALQAARRQNGLPAAQI